MHHTVLDAARAMVAAESSSVLIQDQGEVVGIWTESDALDLQHTYAISHTVLADVMTSPVHTIAENARLDALDRQFRARNTRHSLVVSAGTVPQAVVSEAELVFAVGLEARFARRSLEGYMLEELPVVAAESSIAEAERLMKLSAKEAVVLNDGRLCSMADVVRALAEDDLDRRVGDLPLEPVIGIASTARLGDALRQLRRHGSRYVAVLDDSRKVRGYLGIQRIHQIIESAYLAQLKTRVEGTDRQLRLSSQHLQLAEAVIDASLNSIMIVGANGRIASVNPAFSKVTGYAPEEVVGRTPAVLDSGRHDRAFFEEMRHRLEAEGSWQGEVWNRRKSGETYPEWLSISVIPNDDGGVGQYACIFNDISHQKDIEKENLRLAFSDPLTGLPNRKTFTERLSRAVRAAERDRHKVAALVIDLDLFGRVNDTLGHEVGDDVLTQFAARMAEAVGNDEALARLGADEFAVLLPKLEALEDSVPAVTALDALSKQPFMIDSKEVYLTTSTGISFFPDDGDSAETLLRNATTAMHQSKSNGRNHSRYYTRAMNAQSSDRLDMQSNLRASLDRGELALVYQPKVALLGDRVVSQEALLRWRNRDLGMVPPKVFVPLAEELGIIEEISRWVIREACRQNLVWMHQGLPARRMSVNISAIHMRRGTLVDDVTDILAELDYAPENLDLEVTESAFIENVDEASAMLRQLRDLGITIAIDDFGTGYSSLSYLKKIPADLMKIDSSFVADLESNKDDRQIIQAIIAMGHNLGLEVVAEGVETLAQLSFLRDSGCDQVQGYVFGRPLPPEEYYDVYSEARVPMTAAGGCNCLRG